MSIDYGRLISRSWQITWQNRALWLLGLIIALTSGGGGSSNFNMRGSGQAPFAGNMDFATFWARYGVLIIIGILLLIVIGIALTFVRAAAEASLIAAADRIERTGEQVGFGAAWRMGWPKMLRLWLLGLVTGLLIVALVMVMVVPFVLAIVGTANATGRADGFNAAILGAITLFCGLLLLLLPAILVISLLAEYAKRALVLEDQGVFQSIGTGWSTFRHNLGASLLTWLIVLLIGIGVGLVTLLVLAPFAIGGFFAVLPAIQSGTFTAGTLVLIVVGAIVLGVVAALVSAIPTAFYSVIWTELYLRLRGTISGDYSAYQPAPPVQPQSTA